MHLKLQRPKSLRDKLQEPLPKVELSSTFRATCLPTIIAVAGYDESSVLNKNLSQTSHRRNLPKHFNIIK